MVLSRSSPARSVLKYGSPRLEFFHIIKLYSSRFIWKSWQESRRDALERDRQRAGKIMRTILNFNCNFNYGMKIKESFCLPWDIERMHIRRCVKLLFHYLYDIAKIIRSCFFIAIISRLEKDGSRMSNATCRSKLS